MSTENRWGLWHRGDERWIKTFGGNRATFATRAEAMRWKVQQTAGKRDAKTNYFRCFVQPKLVN